VIDTILQNAQSTSDGSITAVADRREVPRIKLGEQPINTPPGWVVRAQTCFEKLASTANYFQAIARSFVVAVIAPQIAERLLTFKNRGVSNLVFLRSIGSYVGTVPAFWQPHFQGAGRKPLRLRPHKRQPL
jgi:hypothetical protein